MNKIKNALNKIFDKDIVNIIFGYYDKVPKWSRYWKDQCMLSFKTQSYYDRKLYRHYMRKNLFYSICA